MSAEQLADAIKTMEGYLRLRLRLRDWHGVMDAAADIRELEAQLKVLEGRNDKPA